MTEKLKNAFSYVRTHWKNADTAKGDHVSFREYADIFMGVTFNYGAQAPLHYIGFSAGCFLIMYHYDLPYLAFSVISLIGIPLSYLWNILGWLVADNLGFMPKKTERAVYGIYLTAVALALVLLMLDVSSFFPPDSKLILMLNGLSGINAKSFFKIFGVQLLCSGFSGARGIFWRKLLVPKYGRYKYTLYSDVIQKCVMIVLIGWLPIYNITDVNDRLWLAYLLFSLYGLYDFSNRVEGCTQVISPNPEERMIVRAYPVKIAHLLNSVFAAVIPMLGSFDDINFFRWVLPGMFIPCALLTLFFVKNVKERIPEPPIEKKQQVSFWYGIFSVLRNKYHRLNTISGLIDSLGNGMIAIDTVIFLYTLRLSGLEYSLIVGVLWAFRTTLPSFIAPILIKHFSFRQLAIYKQVVEVVSALGCIFVLTCFSDNLMLCGWSLFATLWIRGFIVEPSNFAKSDMGIRLHDYQMYLSGERMENFTGVYGWFTTPITTLVGLIIPVLLLHNGFNSNWDVLLLDDARFNIIVIPLIFDLVGHALMIIPYVFWDYNTPQYLYAMQVLQQRAQLAEEGYTPATYEGGLDFEEGEDVKNGMPAHIRHMKFEKPPKKEKVKK